jgi:N-acetylmuramoyl-L-alanine amidase CwlA
MKIVKSLMTKNPCYTAGKTITVKGLMLHSVGCAQPSAEVFIKQWNSPSYDRACVHGFIDATSGKIYQTLPWNHRGWHCGGSGNNTHIGVEMCEPAEIKYTSGASFTCSNTTKAKAAVKRAYNAAVELFAFLCTEYKLDPMKDIVSHKEGCAKGIASNHGDPEHLWTGLKTGYTMDSFRADVKKKMSVKPKTDKSDSKTEEKAEKKPVKTKIEHKASEPAHSHYADLSGKYVTTANLNMRDGAGTTKQLMITLPKGTICSCYGYYSMAQGVKWLYVVAEVDGMICTGFCSSRYLRKE